MNGSLGIAFGARGSGNTKAHYEPAQVVINLTKKKGAGSLAHEWWHALDNFFGKLEGQPLGYISERYSSKEIRKEVFEAYKNIVKVLHKNMFERSAKIDNTRSKDYCSTTREMTARGFEAYIIAKAKMKGFANDYLANILTEQEYRDVEAYPYPYESEMKEVVEAYDNLFSILKTKETEKGITFYQPAKKDITKNNSFKKWFGDSKVVDWKGEPEVVYHGTENKFMIFKNLGNSRQIGANIGFFFTDSKKMAKQYGNDVRVMPTYLRLKNPLIIKPNTTIKMLGENIDITDSFDFFTQMDTRVSEQDLRNELIKQGYDGIILRNTNVDTRSMEDVHDVYVAFNPEQIKSVNNRGTFNENNPNIYLQDEENPRAKIEFGNNETIISLAQAIESTPWLSKDNIPIALTLEDFLNIGGLILEFKTNLWTNFYAGFEAQIEDAQTIEEVESIEIVY